jgi:CHAT domain-containing protein
VGSILQDYGWQINSHLGVDASEANLKASRSPAVLHIATHGFFLAGGGQSANSMIRSGILLAGVKNKSKQTVEDGILTAYEATILNLQNTRLVVLSACETGLGEVRNGEGVYGLQRGFKVAGAQNLLMSLWKVDDYATALLMTEFYKAWSQDNNIHLAFKKAQQKLRIQYDHPYYWASFILLGN